MKLGSFETLTVAEARAAARQLLARIALGDDPQAERKAKRERAHRRNARRKAADLPAKAIARLLLERRNAKTVQLSARRFGITVRANRNWQHARERAE
jgi:hypothetical protein